MKTFSLVSRFIDFAAPRSCAVCGDRLNAGEDFVCTRCDLHLPRTDYANNPKDNEMARLFWGRMSVERCAAFFQFHHGSEAARIIYGLKYFDHPDFGYLMGRMMAREMAQKGFFEGIDFIAPVPLAKNRERQRGYNQSAEIADGISRETGLRVLRHVAKRQKFHESQTKKNRWERNENVEGSFLLIPNRHLAHHHVLIVDDVVTTGATICAFAKAIGEAKDVKMSILALSFAKS